MDRFEVKAKDGFGKTRLWGLTHATDRLLICCWFLLSLVSVFWSSRIREWPVLVLSCLLSIATAHGLALVDRTTGSKVVRWAHDWAAFPMVVFTYKAVHYMISPLHQGRDYDHILIAVDRALFGVNPTQWLARFSNPMLTETLQIAYASFFFFFIAIGLELYLRRDLRQFKFFRFTVVYGFLISYAFYFLLPAVGPRFTLHDYSKIPDELPGLLFTPYLRAFIDYGESIPTGASGIEALASVQRDVFPSGHTMMTLVAVILSFRFKLVIRRYVLVVAVLLILATVYLRYHYVVDLVAGALLVLPCLLTTERMYEFFGKDAQALREDGRSGIARF